MYKRNILFLILIIWNIVITVMLFNKNEQKTTVTEETVYGISTDLTKVADTGNASCVVINSSFGKQSGFIYKQEEKTVYIVTTYHGIGSDKIATVTLANNKNYSGTIIGSDPFSDVAILSIETEFQTQPVKCGDNELTNEGEFVINIGTNDGDKFINNIQLGVVSKKLVPVVNNVEYQKNKYSIYEEDITLSLNSNEGNSGSPLFNMKSEIIGMVKMTDNNSTYAITINEIKKIADAIIGGEEIQKIDLGISGRYISSLKDYERNMLNIPFEILNGYYVESVSTKKAGYSLGIQQDDVILFINDKSILSQKDMLNFLYSKSKEVRITVFREDRTIELQGSLND